MTDNEPSKVFAEELETDPADIHNKLYGFFSGEEQVYWLHSSIIISWHYDILLDVIRTLATCSMSYVFSWKVLPVSLEHLHFYGASCCHLLPLHQDLHLHSMLSDSVSLYDKRLHLHERIFWWRPSWVMPVAIGMGIGRWIFQITVYGLQWFEYTFNGCRL